MTWDDNARDQVSDLWRAGLSASQIGKKMGVSRSAILGIAHRMNLTPRRVEERGLGRQPPHRLVGPRDRAGTFGDAKRADARLRKFSWEEA